MRTVNIRRFTLEGSTTVATVVREAEKILQSHMASGGIAVDEKTKTQISVIDEHTESILLLDPIIGG